MHHEGLFARLRRAAVSAGLVFACLGVSGLAAPAAAQAEAGENQARGDRGPAQACKGTLMMHCWFS